MKIRKATRKDYTAVWEIFQQVIQTGDTYVFWPTTEKEELSRLWFADNMETFVAEDKDKILGTYMIRPNHLGLGSHIANCGYMVHPYSQGKGVGNSLCEHSISEAKRLGYIGIQFNLVVSTNLNATHIWKKNGFQIVGTIPKGFKHNQLGYVDAYIMYREI